MTKRILKTAAEIATETPAAETAEQRHLNNVRRAHEQDPNGGLAKITDPVTGKLRVPPVTNYPKQTIDAAPAVKPKTGPEFGGWNDLVPPMRDIHPALDRMADLRETVLKRPALPVRKNPAAKFVARITANPEVATALEKASEVRTRFVATSDQLQDELHPQKRAIRLRRAIDNAKDPTELQEAKKALNAIDPASDQAAKSRAKRFLIALADEMAVHLLTALNASGKVIAEIRDEVVASEEEFFAKWGLERKATSVFETLLTLPLRIEQLRNGIAICQKQYASLAPGKNEHSQVFSFFQG